MCATYLALFIASFMAAFGFGFVTIQNAAVPLTAEAVAVAAAPPEDAPAQTDLISCESTATDDEADMLALVGDTFPSSDWTLELGSQYMTDTAAWSSARFGALAFAMYLHYDCGVQQSLLEEYFSPEGFDVLLLNYGLHEQTAVCERNGLRLHEFDAHLNDSDYHLLYWIEQVSPTRVLALNLAFPQGWETKQAAYAQKLFPELPSCDALQ